MGQVFEHGVRTLDAVEASHAYYDARIALLRSEKEEMLQALEAVALMRDFDAAPVTRAWLVSLCIRMGSNDKFKELVS